MSIRYDKAFIEDIQETDEGYLTIKACPITRPGVFPYLRGDGSVEMEAKLPDELFSDKTINSANAKPITDDHPKEPVTASNFPQYSKGMTHTDAKVKNNKLAISFTVTDSATIEKIKAGKRELSIGFSADVNKEAGSYLGQKYDSVQRNMCINHIAIVDKGRAGPSVSIRGDSSAFMVDSQLKQTGGKEMAKIIIDSKEIEVDSIVKARIDTLEAQLETAQTKVSDSDSLAGERDALKTKVTQLEGELEEAKEKVPTADTLDELVADRMQLVAKATKMLGDSFDAEGKSDREVKETVIRSFDNNFKGDGKSDDYVNAFFDSLAITLDEKGYAKGAGFVRKDAKEKETENEIEELKKKRMSLNKKEGE